MSGAQDQAAKASEKQAAEEKPGLLSKVVDSVNFTKYLGFVSDVDSPAVQQALAAVEEKREKNLAEGVPEVGEQPPFTERLKEGVGKVADTAMEASAVGGGGIGPTSGSPKEEAEDLTGIGETNKSDVKPPGIETEVPKEAAATGTAATDESGSKKTGHKVLGALGMGNKTSNSEEGEGEGQGVSDTKAFGRWAANVYSKMGHVVASKDIDLSKD